MAYTNQFKDILPIERCPVCGREFVCRCRRTEWGYWAQSPNGIVIFCSGKCADTFEHQRFMERVRDTVKMKSFQAYKLSKTQQITDKEAVAQMGISRASFDNLILHRWKELAYLEAHEWTA